MQVRCPHPFFADIRALTGSYDSKLAGVGNPLVRQIGRYLHRLRVDTGRLTRQQRATMFKWPVEVTTKGNPIDLTKSVQHCSPGHLSDFLTEVFPWISLGVKRMPGYNAKTGPGPQAILRYSGFTNVSVNSHMLLVCECTSLGSKPKQPPDQTIPLPPNKECRMQPQHQFLVCPILGLQTRLKIVSVSQIPGYSVRCLLLSPVMLSNRGMVK